MTTTKLVSTKALAREHLGVSERHIQNLEKRGKIKPIRLGRRVLWDPAEVIESLKN